MYDEKEILRQIDQEYNEAEAMGDEIVFDPRTKTVRAPSPFDDPDQVIQVTPEDLGMQL